MSFAAGHASFRGTRACWEVEHNRQMVAAANGKVHITIMLSIEQNDEGNLFYWLHGNLRSSACTRGVICPMCILHTQHSYFVGKLVENMTRIMSSPARREKHVVIRSRNETGVCSQSTTTTLNFNQHSFIPHCCEKRFQRDARSSHMYQLHINSSKPKR